MKFELEDNVPIPEGLITNAYRGNNGYGAMLRAMKVGQSFKIAIKDGDKKAETDFNSLRSTCYNMPKQKFQPGRFLIRLIDYNTTTNVKTFRVWKIELHAMVQAQQ